MLFKKIHIMRIKFENLKIYQLLTFLLILFCILVLVFNLINYDQRRAYDYELIYWYVQGLPYQIPTPEQNPIYYHPPLPYFFPSIIDSLCDAKYQVDDLEICDFLWHKISEIFQSVLFLVSILYFYKIFNLLSPKYIDKSQKIFIFLLFFLLPTLNFKTFIMIRAEPYLVFLTSFLIFTIFSFFNDQDLKTSFTVKLGLTVGLMLLTKQSALPIFLGLIPIFIVFLLKTKLNKKKVIVNFLTALSISFIVGGWFYIYQYINNGSIDSYPREKVEFNFNNHQNDYYFYFNFSEVINQPVKHFKSPRMLQILYSDTWGDYWGYYSFERGNYGSIPVFNEDIDKLKRANLLAIVPTILLIFSFFYLLINSFYKILIKKQTNEDLMIITLILISFLQIGFFIYFVTVYPNYLSGTYNVNADTVKAMYLSPLINFLTIFTSISVIKFLYKYSYFYRFTILYCLFYLLTNFNVLTTNF